MVSIDEQAPLRTYSQAMGEDGAHIRLKLDTHEPIALSDFVGSFVGIGNLFEKFIAANHPDLKAESEFFVKDVRDGCVEADLVMWIGATAASAIAILPQLNIIDTIDKAQILSKFVGDLKSKITPYFRPGGRDPKATKSDLTDYHKVVSSIARDPIAATNIEAAQFESDGRNVRSSFKFKSSEAREALREISEHRKELDAKTDENQERVLLRFVRPSVEAGKPGKKGGERGVIESIAQRAMPILYASDLAEQRMRHEILQLQGNVFRVLFDVSVNVELNQSGRPLAYRVTEIHGPPIEDDDADDLIEG